MKSNKKKCKVINLHTKLHIIKRFDNGQSKASISMAPGLYESTVQQILSKSKEHIQQGKVSSTSFSMQCT
jgi:hypothetical protein